MAMKVGKDWLGT